MFLHLNHQQLDVYKVSKLFVKDCYVACQAFLPDERFALVQQIRRAAISVHLNIAEGCSRKSEVERKRYFEVSRGSLIEVDAAFEIAVDLGYCETEGLRQLELSMVRCFNMLTKLINTFAVK